MTRSLAFIIAGGIFAGLVVGSIIIAASIFLTNRYEISATNQEIFRVDQVSGDIRIGTCANCEREPAGPLIDHVAMCMFGRNEMEDG